MTRGHGKTAAILSALLMAGCAQQEPAISATPAAPDLGDAPSMLVVNEPVIQADVAAEGQVAAATESPSTQPAHPALPPGHPQIPGMGGNPAQPGQPAAGMPDLPAGHPDISTMTGKKKPEGMGGMPGGMPGAMPGAMPGGMPPGHPPIPGAQQGQQGAQQPGQAQPASTVGSVTVRAVQGTAGAAPVPAGTPVVIEVLQNGHSAGKLETKLSADGTASAVGVPMGSNLVTVARVTHAGVDYEAVAAPFDGKNSVVQLDVMVYEAGDEKPDWSVPMRHLIAQPAQGKLHVMEVLSVQNPSDRAWRGEVRPDGKRAAFVLPLPPGAADVQLVQGFHDCCSVIEGGSVIETKPLPPGVTQYRLGYTLPISNGLAELTTSLPVSVKAMMIVVASDEALTVTAQGADAPKTIDMGGRKSTLVKGENLPGGRQVRLTIAGITAAAAAPADAKPAVATGAKPASADASQIGRIVGGVGTVLVILLGLSFLLLKPKSRPATGH